MLALCSLQCELLHQNNLYIAANGLCKRMQHWPTTPNIVLLNAVHVASVYTLLHVVGNCCWEKFETGQTSEPTTPNIYSVLWSPKPSETMLGPFAQFFPSLLGPRQHITHGLQSLMSCILLRCTAGPNIVGSYCIRLHTTANKHATTFNIVGSPMPGVVASVCT